MHTTDEALQAGDRRRAGRPAAGPVAMVRKGCAESHMTSGYGAFAATTNNIGAAAAGVLSGPPNHDNAATIPYLETYQSGAVIAVENKTMVFSGKKVLTRKTSL